MNQILYLIFIEIVNSKVIFNRNYSKIKKILIFCAVNLAVMTYMVNNTYNERPKNLYEKLGVARKEYTQEDVVEMTAKMTQDAQMYGANKKELTNVKYNMLALTEGVYNKHYELTGNLYSPSNEKEDDQKVKKGYESTAFLNTVITYMFTFIIFGVFFAAKERAVIKSVFIICVLFIYLEFQILFNDSWEEAIEGALPKSRRLARFEKLEFLKILFNLLIHMSVGFSRVFIDAEKKFIKDDKAQFMKLMTDSSKSISNILAGWSNDNYFKKEEKQAKPKMSNTKKCCYITLAIIFLPGIINSIATGIMEAFSGAASQSK